MRLYGGDTPTGTPVATRAVASTARTADFDDGWTQALPAAALAADGDAPLLLADTDQLPDATVGHLAACPAGIPLDAVLQGGPDVLAPALEDAVRDAQQC